MDSDGPSTHFVTIDAPAWHAVVDDPEQLCCEAIAATLRRAAPAAWLKAAEVSVLLCDDARMRALNASYRRQDRATNVLSFPALALDPGHLPDAPPPLLGDIVLAAGTVAAEAAQGGRRPADHLRHLVVHGCLHLLGHDHQDDAAAARMEALESLILGALGVADPHAEPDAEEARSAPAERAPAELGR
jgi:probable rRNA maturation factor